MTVKVVQQYIDSLTAPSEDEESDEEDDESSGEDADHSSDEDGQSSEDDDSDSDEEFVPSDDEKEEDEEDDAEDDEDLVDEEEEGTNMFRFSDTLREKEQQSRLSRPPPQLFGSWRLSCNHATSLLVGRRLQMTHLVSASELQVVRDAGLTAALGLLYDKYRTELRAFRDRLILRRVAVGMFLSRFLDCRNAFLTIMEAVFFVSRLRIVPMYCERNEGTMQSALASLVERGIPHDLAMVMLQYPSEEVHTSIQWKRETRGARSSPSTPVVSSRWARRRLSFPHRLRDRQHVRSRRAHRGG